MWLFETKVKSNYLSDYMIKTLVDKIINYLLPTGVFKIIFIIMSVHKC